MYFNGAYLTSHSDWETSTTISVPFDEGCVLAARVSGTGGSTGFLASRGDGVIVTDRTWRCVSLVEDETSWFLEDFDDSNWSPAVEYGANDGSLYTRIGGITEDAQWINTADADSEAFYCRKDVCLDCDSIGDVEERAGDVIVLQIPRSSNIITITEQFCCLPGKLYYIDVNSGEIKRLI